jgi:hypothetical protein
LDTAAGAAAAAGVAAALVLGLLPARCCCGDVAGEKLKARCWPLGAMLLSLAMLATAWSAGLFLAPPNLKLFSGSTAA